MSRRGPSSGPPRAGFELPARPLFGRWARRFHLAGIALGAGAAVASATVPPSWVESTYVRSVHPRIVEAARASFGSGTMSAFELLAFALATWVAVRLALGTRAWRRRLDSRRRIVGRGALRTLSMAGWILAVFVASWGLLYRREPLQARHPDLARDPEEVDVRRVASIELEAANALHVGLRRLDASEIEPAVVRGLARALEAYESFPRPVGPPARRFLVLGRVMDAFATSGFCSPWTHEAHVNPSIPAVRVPFVLAHELAHQAGYADETEANFVGWLACLASDHPLARYSAHLAMILYFDAASAYDEGELERRLEPGVLADVAEAHEWSRERSGPASRVSSRLYDAYLRAEGRPEGIRSYGMVVRLVTAHRSTHPEDRP